MSEVSYSVPAKSMILWLRKRVNFLRKCVKYGFICF